MAIQPIDLQTLFTQVDKVGKTQMAQREGFAIQQDIQGTQLQRKLEDNIKSVNETQNTGDDGAEKVKEREGKGQETKGEGEKKKDAQENTPEDEKIQAVVFSDPLLGRNIDISY
jgi:hypothetical protein